VAFPLRHYGFVPPTGVRSRFVETIRLPRRYLLAWIAFDLLFTGFIGWLWVIATMTSSQRAATGAFVVLCVAALFGGPLWLVAMHVVVDDRAMTRRVGHRRTRIPLADVAASHIEPTGEPGLDRVVLTLRNGSEYPVTTRRAEELTSFVRPTVHPEDGA
jgi:hypothetical protein